MDDLLQKNPSLNNLWLSEHHTLRQEIMSLKECQIGILKWAYNILGAVLAFSWGLVLVRGEQVTGAILNTRQALPAAILLLIGTIIGSFLVQILIHKTRSVFRLCGYIRILEKLFILPVQSKNNYPGYENTYHTLRMIQEEKGHVFDINFYEACRLFIKDMRERCQSFCCTIFNCKKTTKDQPHPSSGKYYRMIAFQIHLLCILSLASAIFLLYNAYIMLMVKIMISIISVLIWIHSYIRSIAQTHLQEKEEHSINGQYELWCEALERMGCHVDL